MSTLARNRKVIVCDTDEDTLDAFCKQLEELGLYKEDLVCLHSLDETIEVALNTQPDVIFIDINSKGVDIGLCAALDIFNTDTTIPVILTASADTGISPLRGIAVRGNGLIVKPIQPQILQACLEKIFREVDLERKLSTFDPTLSCCTTEFLREVCDA